MARIYAVPPVNIYRIEIDLGALRAAYEPEADGGPALGELVRDLLEEHAADIGGGLRDLATMVVGGAIVGEGRIVEND